MSRDEHATVVPASSRDDPRSPRAVLQLVGGLAVLCHERKLALLARRRAADRLSASMGEPVRTISREAQDAQGGPSGPQEAIARCARPGLHPGDYEAERFLRSLRESSSARVNDDVAHRLLGSRRRSSSSGTAAAGRHRRDDRGRLVAVLPTWGWSRAGRRTAGHGRSQGLRRGGPALRAPGHEPESGPAGRRDAPAVPPSIAFGMWLRYGDGPLVLRASRRSSPPGGPHSWARLGRGRRS